VQEGALIVCLERGVTKDLISEVAKLQPIRAIFLDSGFAGNDQLKVNAVETFKAKGITFKTV
jgi:adenine-specific DNA-methyltransferase